MRDDPVRLCRSAHAKEEQWGKTKAKPRRQDVLVVHDKDTQLRLLSQTFTFRLVRDRLELKLDIALQLLDAVATQGCQRCAALPGAQVRTNVNVHEGPAGIIYLVHN